MLFSGGLDSAVLLALELRDRDARLADSRARRARLGRRRSAARSIGCLAAPPFAGRVEPLDDAHASTCATSIRRRTGPSSDSRRRTTRPTRTSISKAGTSSLIAKAAVLCARLGIDRLVARAARRQPVPGRDAGVLRGDGASDVARARHDRSRSPRRSRIFTRTTSSAWASTLGVPLAADAVVHEPVGATRTAGSAASAASGRTRFARRASKTRRSTRRVWTRATELTGSVAASFDTTSIVSCILRPRSGRTSAPGRTRKSRDRHAAECRRSAALVGRGTDDDARARARETVDRRRSPDRA